MKRRLLLIVSLLKQETQGENSITSRFVQNGKLQPRGPSLLVELTQSIGDAARLPAPHGQPLGLHFGITWSLKIQFFVWIPC